MKDCSLLSSGLDLRLTESGARMNSIEIYNKKSLLTLDESLRRNLCKIFLASLGLGILYDFGDRLTPLFYYFSQFITFLIIFSPIFLPRKLIILPLILYITICPDLSYVPGDFEYYGKIITTASPWQYWVFNNISPATTLLVTLLLILVRINLFSIKNNEAIVFGYFFIIQLIVFLYFGNYNEPLDRIFTDFKVGLYLLLGLIIFQQYTSKCLENSSFIFQLFFILLISRFFLDFAYLIFGIDRTFISEYSRISVDSAKGTLIFMIFLSLGKIISSKSQKHKVVFAVSTAALFFLLISYQTRWLLVVFAAGFLIYIYLIGWKNIFNFFRFNFLIFVTVLLLISSFLPFVSEVFLRRFSTTFDAPIEGFEQVDVIRVGSIVNSLGKLEENNAFLFGLGNGSFFTEDYFPFFNVSEQDFDAGSISSGRYYRVHDFVFHFLFKYGVIGILLFSYIILEKAKKVYFLGQKNHLRSSPYGFIAFSIFATIPFIITSLFWTAKGLLLVGFFISFCGYIIRVIENENANG
jgi:hypothetical protein